MNNFTRKRWLPEPGLLKLAALAALSVATVAVVFATVEASAEEGKFDVKGGFFQKNAATDGLIEGADLGGRPRRNLASTKQSKAGLRNRGNLDAIRNGLLAGQGGGEETTSEESAATKRDSFAIIPTVDNKDIGVPPDSFAYPQPASAPPQADPAAVANDQSGEQPTINEGRSEEVLQAIQQTQQDVRQLPPGAPAPGTPEYTQRLIDQVKSDGQWRNRSEERRHDVTGNRF